MLINVHIQFGRYKYVLLNQLKQLADLLFPSRTASVIRQNSNASSHEGPAPPEILKHALIAVSSSISPNSSGSTLFSRSSKSVSCLWVGTPGVSGEIVSLSTLCHLLYVLCLFVYEAYCLLP